MPGGAAAVADGRVVALAVDDAPQLGEQGGHLRVLGRADLADPPRDRPAAFDGGEHAERLALDEREVDVELDQPGAVHGTGGLQVDAAELRLVCGQLAQPATAGAGARPPTGRSRRRAGRGRTGCAAASRWGRRRARARPSRRAPRRCRSGPAAGGARPRAAWLSATASRTRRPRTRPRGAAPGGARRDGGRPPRRSAWMRTSSLARRQRALPWRRNRSRARPARRRASWASPPSSATSARVSSTSPTSCQARSRLSCRAAAGQGLVRLGVQAGGQEHPRRGRGGRSRSGCPRPSRCPRR